MAIRPACPIRGRSRPAEEGRGMTADVSARERRAGRTRVFWLAGLLGALVVLYALLPRSWFEVPSEVSNAGRTAGGKESAPHQAAAPTASLESLQAAAAQSPL